MRRSRARTGRSPFQRDPAQYQDVYTINSNGTGLTRLTTDRGLDGLPAWSPDGKKIAFISTRDDPNFDIYTMDAKDGGHVQRLTKTPVLTSSPSILRTGRRSPSTAAALAHPLCTRCAPTEAGCCR
jgi:Tol biopolymer transport system component